MKKEQGFPATRRRELLRRLSPALALLWALALVCLLWTLGATRAWPQSNGWSSSNSSNDLTTWNELSEKFNQDLDKQSTELQQALTETLTSKASSQSLTSLLEQSLQANESLKLYNEEMAGRMRERDKALAAALEKTSRQEKTILVLIIALIVTGGVAAGLAAMLIRRRK